MRRRAVLYGTQRIRQPVGWVERSETQHAVEVQPNVRARAKRISLPFSISTSLSRQGVNSDSDFSSLGYRFKGL